MNLAILSPLQNAYSETFIQAHKKIPGVKVFYYYGMKNFMHLEAYGPLGKSPVKYRYNLERKIKKKGYEYLHENLLRYSFKRNKIQAVLAEYGSTAYDHLPAIKALKLPLIVHFHGYDAYREGALKKFEHYKEVFHYARYVIAVSQNMVAQLETIGCPKEKIVYNVYGPDPAFSHIKPRFAKKQCLAVGRFVDKKAPYLSILAFKEVIKKNPEATLLMAGNGYLLNACKNLVKFYGLEKHIQFLGVIEPKRFMQLLEESYCFVQHSIIAEDGDSEGTPVSILEASAAGLPVVSTRHAGIPDVIENEETGLLVEEMDVQGMTKNILRLLNNKEEAMKMGSKGKRNISKNFNLAQHLKILEDIIKKSIMENE